MFDNVPNPNIFNLLCIRYKLRNAVQEILIMRPCSLLLIFVVYVARSPLAFQILFFHKTSNISSNFVRPHEKEPRQLIHRLIRSV